MFCIVPSVLLVPQQPNFRRMDITVTSKCQAVKINLEVLEVPSEGRFVCSVVSEYL